VGPVADLAGGGHHQADPSRAEEQAALAARDRFVRLGRNSEPHVRRTHRLPLVPMHSATPRSPRRSGVPQASHKVGQPSRPPDSPR
jgi:hypothetical protein